MKTVKEVYDIEGMHCAACSAAVERVTRKLSGVKSADVNLMMKRLDIIYDPERVTPDIITDTVAKAGFGAMIHTAADAMASGATPIAAVSAGQAVKSSGNSRAIDTGIGRLAVSSVFAVLLLAVSMGHMLFPNFPIPGIISPESNPQNFALLQLLLALPVLFIGRDYFTGGFTALFHMNPNMNSLVAISSAASFIYSLTATFLIPYRPEMVHSLYFESAAVVITLVSVGKYLEERSTRRTGDEITKLMQLSPDTANVCDELGSVTRSMPTNEVGVGDILLVRSGENLPLDGVVIDGIGSVNEAMLTGESVPVEKSPGDRVIGGSNLSDGVLYIRVSATGGDTALAKIIKFIEDAQGKKAPISRTADRVAGVFVPVIIVIALLSATGWLIGGMGLPFALNIFTSVLVIACPCAMGLATPTAIMVGTGLGASYGILIRSGEALEVAHRTDVAVFDKTGTLTEGSMSLCDLLPLDGNDAHRALALAAAAERLSVHPLSRAICKAADAYGLTTPDVSDFKSLPGMGISATDIDGKRILVGNLRLMNVNGVHLGDNTVTMLEKLQSEGKTVVCVAQEGREIALLAVADKLRPEAVSAVGELKRMGIETMLLTGDSATVADVVGRQVGCDRVISGVLPTDKAEEIKRLRLGGHSVMMIGDGINDAPALTEADTGLAVGGGSDIAVDSADVILMGADINGVCRAIRLSRLTIRNIKQNLFWAFCYNILAVPVAAGVLYPFFGILLSPMIGGLAMSLSSLFVVGNALRLGRYKL